MVHIVLTGYNQKHNIYLDSVNIKNNFDIPNLYGAEEKDNKPNWSKNHPFHWLAKAENGDSEAMLQLGIIYHRDSDNEKAKLWYTKALEAGHPRAQERLDVLELTMKYEQENINNKDI